MKRNLDSGLSRAELVYEECAERVRILRHERKIMLETRKDELKNAHRYLFYFVILICLLSFILSLIFIC